jgi:hypothetical protein
MDQLNPEDVAAVITMLNNRLRADPFELKDLDEKKATELLQQFHDRKLPETAAVRSNRHVVLTGRRGAGKTSTMMRAYLELWLEGFQCVWIDVQTFRRDSHAAVSAQIAGALMKQLLVGVPSNRRQYGKMQKNFADLIQRLEQIARLKGSTTVEKVATIDSKKSASSGLGASLGLDVSQPGLNARVGASSQSAQQLNEGAVTTTHLNYEIDPIDELEEVLLLLRAELEEFSRKVIAGDPIFIFLDDFYYVPRAFQAHVADLLHRLTKNLNIWVKIGAVKHRLELFVPGDPPIGLEAPHDATFVSLDVSLDHFSDTRAFLEQIVKVVADNVGLGLGDLVTEVARPRLVLASGGVPRDYLYLLASALESHARSATITRVSAETVNDVAPQLLEQKYADLDKDVESTKRVALTERLNDIHNDCIKVKKVNVFTVESESLGGQEWGREIAALGELRLLHYVGSITLKTSQKASVGVRYAAYCLDLSAYAGTRVRSIKQIEFWTAVGKQQLRKKEYVYTPSGSRSEPAHHTVMEGQQSLFIPRNDHDD